MPMVLLVSDGKKTLIEFFECLCQLKMNIFFYGLPKRKSRSIHYEIG